MRAALLLLLLAAGTDAAGFRAVISPLMTQADAKRSCVAQAGFLATISASSIQEVSELMNSARTPVYGVWVGAEDRATEGEFVWQDGSAASDAPWYPGRLIRRVIYESKSCWTGFSGNPKVTAAALPSLCSRV